MKHGIKFLLYILTVDKKMTGLQDQLKKMLMLFLMCTLQTGHFLFRDMTSVAQTRHMVWPHGSITVLISLSSQIVHTGTCDSYKKNNYSH